MPRRPSAKRYALALYQLAQEKGQVERWHADLQSIDEALKEREFSSFLQMPKIRLSQKIDVIREALPELDPLVCNLLALLVSRGTTDTLAYVHEEYGKLLDNAHGRARAYVVSAVPLETVHQQRLTKFLSELIGKEIELTASVDTKIIAGLVARVGDRLIDGSAKTKLKDLKKSLTGAAF